MASMRKKVEKKGGKKKEMITVDVKKGIIKKYERGMQVAEIARFYKKSTSASHLQRGRKRQRNPLLTNEMSEMWNMWETVQNFVEMHHLNKAVAMQAMTMQCHTVLKRSKSKCHWIRSLLKLHEKRKIPLSQ